MKLSLCSEKVLFLDKVIKSTKSEYMIFEVEMSINIYLYSTDLSQMSIIRLDKEFFDNFEATEAERVKRTVFAIPYRKLHEQNMKFMELSCNYDHKNASSFNSDQIDSQIFYYEKSSSSAYTNNCIEKNSKGLDQNSSFISTNVNASIPTSSANCVAEGITIKEVISSVDIKYSFSSMNLYRRISTANKEIYDIEFSSNYSLNIDLSGIRKLIFDLKEKSILFNLGKITSISAKTFNLTIPGGENEKKFELETDFLKNMIINAALFDEYTITLSEDAINFVFSVTNCTFSVFTSI